MTQPPEPGVDWYESEQHTRLGLVAELQRLWQRIKVRPLPVLLVAGVITAGITRKVATKQPTLEADVVLALSEGSLASRQNAIPVDELRQYVTTVLLPAEKLTKLIEKRDRFRLRKTPGPVSAIDELRESLSVQIWKNSFVYYNDEDSNAQRSARIGLSVSDTDPDRAFDTARDLASIVMETAAAQRKRLAAELENQAETLRRSINHQLDEISVATTKKQAAIDDAIKVGRPELGDILRTDLIELGKQQQALEQQLDRIVTSPETLANEIAAAGLDWSLKIVEEHRPERPTRSGFVVVMIAFVVGAGALVGAALVLGAFDSRVHDADDVARLGLPVLGHVPGFAGDKVGSMLTRSARRARVPSFLRWRSHR